MEAVDRGCRCSGLVPSEPGVDQDLAFDDCEARDPFVAAVACPFNGGPVIAGEVLKQPGPAPAEEVAARGGLQAMQTALGGIGHAGRPMLKPGRAARDETPRDFCDISSWHLYISLRYLPRVKRLIIQVRPEWRPKGPGRPGPPITKAGTRN